MVCAIQQHRSEIKWCFRMLWIHLDCRAKRLLRAVHVIPVEVQQATDVVVRASLPRIRLVAAGAMRCVVVEQASLNAKAPPSNR